MKEQMPHLTRNTALAVTAFLLRIPVTRRRIYTEEFLKNKRTTAKRAYADGVLGEVHYAIHTEKDQDHKRAVIAFNEEKLLIEEGQIGAEIEVDIEVIARLCCRLLFARKNFFKDLLQLKPFMRIKPEGEITKTPPAADGSHVMKVPGFKDVRIDADEKTREEMGL